MEDEDDVQGDEFRSGDGEGEADEDGVKDDAELEDEDGSKLGGVGLSQGVGGRGVRVQLAVGNVGALVAEVVFAARVGVSGAFDVLGSFLAVLEAQVVRVRAAVAVGVVVVTAKFAVAHHHQLEEEHDEDDHESNAFGPWVDGDDALETLVTKSLVCWCEQVDEGCGDDDAGSKVLCNEEDPRWNEF